MAEQATKQAAAFPVAPLTGVWAQAAQQAAVTRFEAIGGYPKKRDEYWRYTNPAKLVDDTVQAALFDAGEPEIFGDVDRLALTFVDGVLDVSRSDAFELDGISLETLAEAGAADIHWAKDLFGTLEAAEHGYTPRPLAVLNTALAEQGVVIRVTEKVKTPISIRYERSKSDNEAIIHHVIKVEEGAELTVLESGVGAARFNCVLEVAVAKEASFHHVRTQGRDHERLAATGIFASLEDRATFKSFTLTVNGALTRNEAAITFNGDDAHATVAGVSVGDGPAFHDDDTVFVTHDAVNCESRQVFKKVLRNGATGVFQGKILVQPDAQKTDGYQISQGLLLDEDSNFLAKPELEIYADDVACSHGSTCGALDETALFYLRSRGVPLDEAQDMLVLSFLGEAIEEIEDDALAGVVLDRLAQWLVRHQG